MKPIESSRDYAYYKMMYRRAVMLCCVMSALCALLVMFLFYAYAQRPERAFYASAKSYKITRLQPLE